MSSRAAWLGWIIRGWDALKESPGRFYRQPAWPSKTPENQKQMRDQAASSHVRTAGPPGSQSPRWEKMVGWHSGQIAWMLRGDDLQENMVPSMSRQSADRDHENLPLQVWEAAETALDVNTARWAEGGRTQHPSRRARRDWGARGAQLSG